MPAMLWGWNGTLLDDTQADVNLVLSHVNSYRRLELGGMSAFEMMQLLLR